MKARDNPFATDRVLRIRYRLAGGDWSGLWSRLARLQYRAALVGPEGSGKTTLLEDLAAKLPTQAWTPHWLRLDREKPRFPTGFVGEFLRGLGPHDIVLLDGAERLGCWAWRRFRRRCRRLGGLVVTSHRAGLLPTLLACRTTPALLAEIVQELIGPSAAADWQDQIPALFEKHRGNVREALRELYDRWAGRGGNASHLE